MAWDEAQYTSDEILKGIEVNQITGIPPQNVTNFLISAGNKQIKIKCTPPEDTIINGELLCTVAGMKIIRKEGSAPISLEDGILIADVLRGQTFETIDENLVNGITYYYRFFPYSNHGVYNYNPGNIHSAIPTPNTYWAFDQNFADLNPETTITYPAGYANSNFAKMHTNEGTGEVTAGDWLDFLQKTLKNFPFLVRSDGTADYPLNPDNYEKKMDGSDSKYSYYGTVYNGGNFAWLNKIYMRETYSSDGESRRVEFSDGPSDGFYPVGFYDRDMNELEGVWIPMGYTDIMGGSYVYGGDNVIMDNYNVVDIWKEIQSFSPRAAFLGGPIMNVLRDLEYMLFKTTNIPEAAGYGRCYTTYSGRGDSLHNEVIKNGAVPGWKGTGKTSKRSNKYFHSQVLGSYYESIVDPYTLDINDGILKMSDHYIYDLTGNELIDAGKIYHNGASINRYFPSHLIKVGNTLGSMPKKENQSNDESGTSLTGLCDELYLGNQSVCAVCRRLGHVENNESNIEQGIGPGYINLKNGEYGFVYSGTLLLPPPGYAPDI